MLLSSLLRRRAATLLAACCLLLAACPPASHAQDEATAVKTDDPLTTYRSKNRVLLIFAPAADDPSYKEQMGYLQEKASLEERDLVVLPILADDTAAGKSLPYLQGKFNREKSGFALVLVGKDGSEAYRSTKPVTAAAIFDTIDAMPMRKDEIKQEKKADATDKGEASSKKE